MKLSLVIGLGLALSLSACSGRKEASKMNKLADDMCACKTVECADKLFPEIEKFSNENAGKEVEASAADDYNAAITRIEACMTKLAEAAVKSEK